MEKCNAVQEGRTPCRKCQGGHSEYVCESCASKPEKEAQDSKKLDPEKMAEEHA